MQLNTKHLIITLLLGGAMLCFYYGFRGDTEVKPSQNSSIISGENTGGIETDTGKRLETFGNSGTNWGMSPFGSGKPLEEEKKPEFKKPNTEWKTRTLSGITYVFGEGNPKEVGLSSMNIQEESRACELNQNPLPRICREGMYGYVTPEIEQGLKKVLESPLWNSLAMECEKEYLVHTEYRQFHENILAPHALDISRFLIIDPNTGRKELEIGEIRKITNILMSVGNFTPESGVWTNLCIEKNGKPLYQMFENISELYSSNIALAIQQNRFASPGEIRSILNRGLPDNQFLINP